MTTSTTAVTSAGGVDRPAGGPVTDQVTGGVDTHKDAHLAAALDSVGRVLGTRSFPATTAGHADLLAWLSGFGPVTAVGVEGTGSYGAGLARHLTGAGTRVIEVDRPDRATRRRQGKSDPVDALAAARAVQSGRATGTPKTRTGPVEAIRVLHTVRHQAVTHRTAAINHLKALATTAPDPLHDTLTRHRGTPALLTACLRLRPTGPLTDPLTATRTALRRLARRIRDLDTEIARADRDLDALVAATAPTTVALHCVGTHTAARLLITAGDNPDRLRDDAAFARLTGSAPIPASSGRTDRHRLHRGGDRQANKALHQIVIVRMRHCERTRTYVTRRTAQGLTKKEIIRCLKRYVAREIHTALTTDLTPQPTTT
jgi:transposase